MLGKRFSFKVQKRSFLRNFQFKMTNVSFFTKLSLRQQKKFGLLLKIINIIYFE